ncbi:histidine kinase [Robertmurraya yapensis]|uniref:Signal transduction histidine-protein kinase/phosphatase DegS n=1 Tax=Bacillus yapensis TaxID=2492960 RepID=A0A431WLS3_9BACI|nr:sensor histidine kinase [Bacillus yapensis]RTR36383.1 histidine kinase [Bacillus yapensis]TKT05887.1 histidine kinase [Bacillus yapensis]
MIRKFDTKTLDMILDKMVETVGDSKDEIFRIGEQCRREYDSLIDELRDVRRMVGQIIEEGDELEAKSRLARKRLSEVSMHFKDYTEVEVREAYEKAHQIQMDLTMNRQTEKQLRGRRDDIERRLVGLTETIDKAERLVSQITVVMNYLTSDLKKMTEVIEDAKMKQDFGLKIIEAQEEERKRLSREIHDGPAQMMANVMMRSDLIEKVYNEYGAKDALTEVKNLKKMVRNALYEVRRIIYDLRPMALDDLGLVPTLKKYLKTIEEYHSTTRITYKNIGEEKRLPSKFEVALFRLVQESVQNALKHANAGEIVVKLEMKPDKIIILIKDDGQGFDPKERKAESFGIIGMRERVELLSGEITIDSNIGKGTVVLIQVPLEVK